MLELKKVSKRILAGVLSTALFLSAGQVFAGGEQTEAKAATQQRAARDASYDDGSDGLTEMEALQTVSKDESNVVRIWKDSSDRYY